MKKQRIRREIVPFVAAEPAPFGQILLYLLTGGRWGRVYQRRVEMRKLWHVPPDHINCRCVQTPITKEKDQ